MTCSFLNKKVDKHHFHLKDIGLEKAYIAQNQYKMFQPYFKIMEYNKQ